MVLPLTFGEVLAIMGFWSAIGALAGQNKLPKTSTKDYLAAKNGAVLGILLFFRALVLVYLASDQGRTSELGAREILGFAVLMVTGMSLGFIIGIDKTQRLVQPSDTGAD